MTKQLKGSSTGWACCSTPLKHTSVVAAASKARMDRFEMFIGSVPVVVAPAQGSAHPGLV